MAELDAGGKHNSEQISEIDLTDPEDARVLMPEQGADILAHFGEDHFLERYQRYKAHIAEWRQQYPHLAAVDLRYDNQVVLQMASGKQTAETAGGDAAHGLAAPAAGDRTSATQSREGGGEAFATRNERRLATSPRRRRASLRQTRSTRRPQKRAAAQSATEADDSDRNKRRPAAAATTWEAIRAPWRPPAVTVAQGG